MENDVTRLLEHVRQGDERADERLMAAVYEELRGLASARLAKEQAGQTIQATALVHEAYLRLFGDEPKDWKGRRYFFAACAEAMRRILVERARAKGRLKRGGQRERVPLEEAAVLAEEPSVDLLALDEALEALAGEAPRKAELVKLRYFTGLTMEEAALALGVSKPTAERDWTFAKAWLYDRMRAGD